MDNYNDLQWLCSNQGNLREIPPLIQLYLFEDDSISLFAKCVIEQGNFRCLSRLKRYNTE